jgi:hypothetical protein
MTTRSCLDCRFANWARFGNGRLHPNGDGRCKWVMPVIVLPKSRYFSGYNSPEPEPSGGYIDRKKPHTDFPAWEVRT